MKKILLFLVFLFIGSALGALNADVKIIKNSIFMDETATFLIRIINPDKIEKTLQIYSSDIAFFSETEPSVIKIMPESELNVTLKLTPNSWSNFGAKGVSTMIISQNSEKIELQIPVYIKSYDTIEKKYSPSVELKIDFPDQIDPRENYPLTIYLRNRNKLDIKSMNILIRSKYFNYDLNELSLEPFPNGERKENIIFSIDKTTIPQEDRMEVILFYENKSFNRERFVFRIMPYSELKIKEDVREELFKKSVDYYILNEGNVKNENIFKHPTTILKKLFTSTSPMPSKVNLKKDGYLSWNLELEPNQEIKISVTENYRPVIYFFFIVIISINIYFLYRSPLTGKKEGIITGKSTEGITNMKVLIHLRNRTQDLIENIKITDLVPSIAEFIHEEQHGTLMPSKIIKNDKKGTYIKWELEALEPFEERLISYRIKSKIAIVGGINLPPVKIKFESKGKERTIKSNKCQISLSVF